MDKKNRLIISATCVTATFVAASLLLAKKWSPILSKSDESSYTLRLTNQKISSQTSSYLNEVTSTVTTTNGNEITIKASNVIKNDDGWQTILPGGYFYNPIDGTEFKNKINGLTSISFQSSGSNSLTLSAGQSIDGAHITYSHEQTLSPNTPLNLSDELPTYFYVKNNSGNSIDISEFKFTYTCQESDYSKKNLNVLMIGNSFSDDTVFYASRIASSYGINLNLYDAYIGGCTINTHYSNLQSGATSYSMRSIANDSWNYQNDMSLTAIIESQTWDVITFQQASAEVGRSNSYANLANLVNAVRDIVGDGPRFYWYQTWAYDSDYHDYYDYFAFFNNDQDAMYTAINSCYRTQVEPLGLFDKTIPAGTAVQNLRTSYMKDTFSRDGKHMSSVHGRYLLGLNFISNIFDIDLDMSPSSYMPQEVNASFNKPAYEAIKNAYNNPLSCTNSIYTTPDLGGYDLSNYTEIDAELLGCSYWNSTDSNNYNKRISNSSGSSNLYTTTKRFTPSTLPIGSLVVIGESFGVRPEAWTNDAAQSTRPSETYVDLIEVNQAFWSGYQYRAFNIFKAGKTDLKGQYDQIFDTFHIYVPNDKLDGLKIKGVNDKYESDKTLMSHASINIDAFERLHLDPITGFYKCDSYYELTNSYTDDTAKKFVCSRPFYGANGDLPENTVIIVDSGYQWRSDCWGDHGSYSPRPGNVTSLVTLLDSSFWNGLRRRTFNVSSTSSSYVGQNYIDFMNHLRIYVPVSDDMFIERESTVTMTALGYATLNGTASSIYGKSDIPVLITLHGDDTSKVKVEVDGSTISTPNGYKYNQNTGALTIETDGTIGGSSFTFGKITGVVHQDAGNITNVSVDGRIKSYLTNNGSITCSESWFDRCNYSTNAASQAKWQRWYDYGFTPNTTSGEWTTSNNVYLLENDYSMGLRIAGSQHKKTKFTLREDFNSGAGFTPKGISIWIYNPNGDIYPIFRIYVYTSPSTASGNYVTPDGNSNVQIYQAPSGIGDNEWKNIKLGLSVGKIYNVAFYFETNSSAVTYVYLGHVSFY